MAESTLWAALESALVRDRMPGAMLLLAPSFMQLTSLVKRLISHKLCQLMSDTPCGVCQGCRWVQQDAHPDVHFIKPEDGSSGIKIEAIRDLCNHFHARPQQGLCRFVVIEKADKMTISAANALLKMLEEPPEDLFFILIAEQTETLPATILSRCQRYVAQSQITGTMDDLALASMYAEDTPRAILYQKRAVLIQAFETILTGKDSPCMLAEQWSSYELEDILWFLYLLTMQMIRMHILPRQVPAEYTKHAAMLAYTQQCSVILLFEQIDKITERLKAIKSGHGGNKTLVLETILLGYV